MAPLVSLLVCVCYLVLRSPVIGRQHDLASPTTTDMSTEPLNTTSPIVGRQNVTQFTLPRREQHLQMIDNTTPDGLVPARTSTQQTVTVNSREEEKTNDVIPSEKTSISYAENTTVSSANETTRSREQSTEAVTADVGRWRKELVKLEIPVYIVGFVANTMTLITLMRNGDMFSPSTCLLLKHQALVDSWVCAAGAILILQPPMWTTGNKYFDTVVCFIWHSQAPFWCAILLSVWNLAAIALERYMAICFPFKNGKFREELSRKSIAVIYVVNVIVTIPCVFEVRFEHGACIWENFIEGYTGKQVFYAYGLIWFFAEYVLPVIAYVFLYGRIVLTLYRRKKSTDLSRSAVVDAAQAAITKTAVTLTAIFLFAIGFDAWYYVLGNTGVVDYEEESATAMVAVFFSVVNSCVNPFVYLFLITQFRFMVFKTFFCYTKSNGTTNSSESTNTSV